jgi:hypothetical protein
MAKKAVLITLSINPIVPPMKVEALAPLAPKLKGGAEPAKVSYELIFAMNQAENHESPRTIQFFFSFGS